MTDRKIKVIKLEKLLKHYNVPVNNLLNEKFDYTVLYCKECDDDGRENWKFKSIYEPLEMDSVFLESGKNMPQL